MPRADYQPADYLTKDGKRIFKEIVKHVTDKGIIEDIDVMELSMLANSFDLYSQCASKCNEVDGGYIRPVTGKNGTFDAVAPEYSIMKNEYTNILKHSPKFGLNPGDRAKIFKNVAKKKKDPTDGID